MVSIVAVEVRGCRWIRQHSIASRRQSECWQFELQTLQPSFVGEAPKLDGRGMVKKSGSRFLALLRGINVGGRNVIGKDELRGCFESLGLVNVRTYIQSGNVLFRSSERSVAKLTAAIEDGLSTAFSYHAQALVLPHRRYRSALAAAPDDWGVDADQKHNAIFTLGRTTTAQVLAGLPPLKQDFETVTTAPGVIFWTVSRQHQTKTTMMKLAAADVYQQVTVRNHNTVF
mgnify:CR=1 FL=1